MIKYQMQSFENKATYLNIRNVLLFLMNTCLPSWNGLVVYKYLIKKQSGTCSMEFKKMCKNQHFLKNFYSHAKTEDIEMTSLIVVQSK